MNFVVRLAILAIMALPVSTLAFESPPGTTFHNGLSLQGFTGNLNTPSAHVTGEGDFYALYTNQKENEWRDMTSHQNNYLFSLGFFSIAEIGGRVTSTQGVGNHDLSANFKLTTKPFLSNYPYAPVFALGVQDFSGGASKLRSKYAVISEDIWRFRLSAGYGSGPDRMKGTFAGGEFKAHDWIYLLADYDTKETNVGARIVLPHFWKVPISFTATAKTSLDNRPGNFDIAFGLSLPLDFKVNKTAQKAVSGEQQNSEPVSQPPPSTVQYSEQSITASQVENPKPEIQHHAATGSPASLRDRLVKAGFQNVRVGVQGEALVVIEYENVTFNHNEMDALGVITGMAAETLPDTYKTLRLIIKKKNIRMMQVTLPLSAAAKYLETGRDLAHLKGQVLVQNSFSGEDDIAYTAGDANSSLLTASLALSPGLDTKIATDYAAFDYSLSVKPELYVNLWKGAQVNLRWDVPVSRSDNMDGRLPYYYNPTPSRMERLMLFQGIKLLPGVMASVGGGQILPHINGTMSEISWQPGDGSHLVTFGQARGKNDTTDFVQKTYLVSYRYYFSPLDLTLEGTAGKFWSQDNGYKLELKRFFGDTAVSVYYKSSKLEDSMSQGYPPNWKAAGIQFAFPLTPEKDMKHYYNMQVRGTEQWSYSQETTIASANSANANYLPPVPLALNLLPSTALNRSYYNRDRLSGEYITTHLERMREAWLKYKDSL
jgi:hypothetical protein